MKYTNREMKIDQIIGYFNAGKISLIPPFQRGSVWTPRLRQALVHNMLKSRPIPAIFLYKQAAGTQFSYNILDGKQRLETLLLFVGDKRSDMKIDRVDEYFFKGRARRDLNFKVKLDGKLTSFKDLDVALIRSFREYSIPTVEIDLDDESASIDDIVSLFVDINQLGVKVTRFEVLRALSTDRFLNQVLGLIAIRQQRGKSNFYKVKKTPYSAVLKQLHSIQRITDNNSQVDRMWERLTELAMFLKTGTHRSPVQLLSAFIGKNEIATTPIAKDDLRRFRTVFEALESAYKASPDVKQGKFATDQAVFYTLVTTLMDKDLAPELTDVKKLTQKLALISGALSGKASAAASAAFPKPMIKGFNDLLLQGTADPSKRSARGELLKKLLQLA